MKLLEIPSLVLLLLMALPCAAQTELSRTAQTDEQIRAQIRQFSIALVERAQQELTPPQETPALQEPGWTGGVIKLGAERAVVQSTPILERSYRPFHFYGNTVRRRYYRGYTLPRPKDMWQGTANLIRPR